MSSPDPSPETTVDPAAVQASFVVVANRLPVDRVNEPDGSVSWRTSPGGLVTALEPVMKKNEGAWVGWHGAPDERLEPFEEAGMTLVPVPLSTDEVANYYEGFANATLWPLYHDAVAPPEYHREWWDAFVRVNQRFADLTAEVAEQDATVWVQDYQLHLVPQMLRKLRPDLNIGFFLHIPFPPVELFTRLPWRRQLIEGLLGADLIGFQLPGGAQNFLRLVRQRLRYEIKKDTITRPDGHTVAARAYPISIDAESFAELAAKPEVQQRADDIRRDLGNPQAIILGVDRLDYTKGIFHRLRAFGELVREGRVGPDEAVFLQVATPSRERVDQYRRLRDDIDRLVGRINGDLGTIGRPPITYLHSSFPRAEMAAMYLAADVLVVTPLRDGMNLVAKEYVVCRADESGALVLSEFAGAAYELKQAYMINPYDVNDMKATMELALHDTPERKAKRMRSMRKQVFDHDIGAWAEAFLTDLHEVHQLSADPS